MTNTCREKLENIIEVGSNREKRVAQSLLEGVVFSKIVAFSRSLEISTSSASRFIEKIGYNGFREFKGEYFEGTDFLEIRPNKELNEWDAIVEDVNKLDGAINGKIWIAPSKRSFPVALEVKETLLEQNIECEIFSQYHDAEVFFQDIERNDTLFIFSLTGYSLIANDFIKQISFVKDPSKLPKIVIITTEQWMRALDQYSYVSVVKIPSSQADLEKIEEYNKISLLGLKTMDSILKFHPNYSK